MGPPRRHRRRYQHRGCPDGGIRRDRKSTRLNSSHGYISYAVFCLKKKKPEHYLTLLNLSKAIASHRDLTKLFHDLTCRLHMLLKVLSLTLSFHKTSRTLIRSRFR